jgi:hypothetical protein
MDPVDLQQRLLAQEAGFRRTQAQLREGRRPEAFV